MNWLSGVSGRIIHLVFFEKVVFCTLSIPQVQSSKLAEFELLNAHL
jgi:hypothetical protein